MVTNPDKDPPKSGHPLRRPHREASRAIYDAVLEATAALITRDGLEELTSNKIAERAGVSIGSFYRYFANKRVVIAELARRRERETLDHAMAALAQADSSQPRELARALVASVLNGHETASDLRRAMLEEVPRRWIREANANTAGTVETQLGIYLHSQRAALRPGDPALMAFVLVRAVEGVVEAALVERPEVLENGLLENELVELTLRFIGADSSTPPAPPSS